jgi:hypothetical protein
MTDYPTVDADVSGYTAAVAFDADGATVVFPGRHLDYAAAAARARKLASAIRAAGEMGCRAKVGWVGERPAGFPRNGVML